MSSESLRRRSLQSPSLQDLNVMRKNTNLLKSPFHFQVCDYQNFAKKFHHQDKIQNKLLPKPESPRPKVDCFRPQTQSSRKHLPALRMKENQPKAQVERSHAPYIPVLSISTRAKITTQRFVPKQIGSLSARKLTPDDWFNRIKANKQRTLISKVVAARVKRLNFDESCFLSSKSEISIIDSSSDESLEELVKVLGGR